MAPQNIPPNVRRELDDLRREVDELKRRRLPAQASETAPGTLIFAKQMSGSATEIPGVPSIPASGQLDRFGGLFSVEIADPNAEPAGWLGFVLSGLNANSEYLSTLWFATDENNFERGYIEITKAHKPSINRSTADINLVTQAVAAAGFANILLGETAVGNAAVADITVETGGTGAFGGIVQIGSSDTTGQSISVQTFPTQGSPPLLFDDQTSADFLKVEPALDLRWSNSAQGPILRDRSDANSYRITVTAGVLGTEVA